MALQMNYAKYGNTFTNAYFWVANMVSDTTNGYSVNVYVYYNAAARLNGEEYLGVRNHTIPFTETIGNPVQQFNNPLQFAYALLKTLPEYASATDV